MNRVKYLISAGILLAGISSGLFAQPQQPAAAPSGPALSEYFTPVEAKAAPAKPEDKGFIRRWTLLEPISFPNRTNTVFTDSYIRETFAKPFFKDQFTTVPKNGATVKVEVEAQAPVNLQFGRPAATQQQPAEREEQTLAWHFMDSKLYNVKLFRFATGLDKSRYGVIFWAVTVVNCTEDIPNVRFAAGSNSASMWWLNGEEVLILSGDRRMVADDGMSKRISLKKGRNIIRGAVINGPGMSDFCVRFLDEDGHPVQHITITNQ